MYFLVQSKIRSVYFVYLVAVVDLLGSQVRAPEQQQAGCRWRLGEAGRR